jgi:hypothetical protein
VFTISLSRVHSQIAKKNNKWTTQWPRINRGRAPCVPLPAPTPRHGLH